MITMRDIAVRAGVSRSTVSFVLNEKHDLMGVNEETRRHVLRVAKEMGYRRNQVARAVVTGRMLVLGFLVPRDALESEVTARILSGALDEADARGYTIQVFRVSEDTGESVVRRCIELRPTGVMGLYLPPSLLPFLQGETAAYRIPVVALDSTPSLEGGTHILSDDAMGCRAAVEHLAALGHRRIAYIGGNPTTVVSALRAQGYRAAMESAGLPIPPGYEEVGRWDPETTQEATRRLFDLPEPPTALFCADDKTALVASRTLHALGLEVPRDVSLVGFADLAMASYCDPLLTTVAQPFQQMGRRAVVRLLEASRDSLTPRGESSGFGDSAPVSSEERLPTRLIVRQSTGPVRS